MNFVESLKNSINEQEIEKISADIADYTRNKLITCEDIQEILNFYNNTNLLSLKYDTREQILYTISEIANFYQIDKNEIKNIYEIRDCLEDDLREYIDEICIGE